MKNFKKNCILLIITFIAINAISGDMEEADEAFKKSDYQIAFKKYKLAAEKGNSMANIKLGNIYDSGLGVKQDFSEAISYYKVAASQGHILGFVFVSAMLENGQGIEKNLVESEKWKKYARLCMDKKSLNCEIPN